MRTSLSPLFKTSKRFFSQQCKTGIVMLNMGGPKDPKDTAPFLKNLFSDPDIIPLGGGKMQDVVSDLVVKRRSDKVQKQYEEIGGSPILKWTQLQGDQMVNMLNDNPLLADYAPFKAYPCFRYVPPFTEDVLKEMESDGIKHAIAFSQYPQWCCNTSGSSYNYLFRRLRELNITDKFKWSIIDRWYMNDGYINAIIENINISLTQLISQNTIKDDVLILFSAHSVPMKTVGKGDVYIQEVSTSVELIMNEFYKNNNILKNDNIRFQLCWQSKVGYLPWMVPTTEEVIEKTPYKHVLVVPFVFTSDHIETLFELDIEYKETSTKNKNIQNYIRVGALNDNQHFINGLADIVESHLTNGQNYSNKYKRKCHKCVNDNCRNIENPFFDQNQKTVTDSNNQTQSEETKSYGSS